MNLIDMSATLMLKYSWCIITAAFYYIDMHLDMETPKGVILHGWVNDVLKTIASEILSI